MVMGPCGALFVLWVEIFEVGLAVKCGLQVGLVLLQDLV
jgi:hypothetical protein